MRWCVGSCGGSERRIREGGGLGVKGAAERKASDLVQSAKRGAVGCDDGDGRSSGQDRAPRDGRGNYGHLLPEFVRAEVNRLHFGVAGLLESGKDSQAFAAPTSPRVTPGLHSGPEPKGEAGTPPVYREIPAFLLAGRTGLESAGT